MSGAASPRPGVPGPGSDGPDRQGAGSDSPRAGSNGARRRAARRGERRAAGGGASGLYLRIWAVVKRIPRGRVATYGQIAALAGIPRQPRIAGYALHRLPEGARAPWHRVINARGQVSPRSGGAGEEGYQRALLEAEGVRFENGRVDLERFRWRPRRPSARLVPGGPGSGGRGR